jgi:ubiquitin carboxyl-terminal hydrolase 14
VVVKHAGKKYDVELDPTSTGVVFKFQMYSLTGVEPERQKILVKGGQLKDDTELSKIGAKPGQVIMMMGTPSGDGAVVARPKEKMKFMEDMSEAEQAAQEGATPAGLDNLGNTCYLNSTLQTLRAVPELHQELMKYTPAGPPPVGSLLRDLAGPSGMDLTASLRDVYNEMGKTQSSFPPLVFLNSLRQLYPQFAQRSRTGQGYAQQDAEEAWSQILSQLRQKLKIRDSNTGGIAEATDVSFIDKYMAGRFQSVLECEEPAAKEAGEEPIVSEDTFLKLDCHISATTNHLRDGIANGLEEKLEKNSPALGRDAVYVKKSKIARLPKYLTVHFVRFFWKREVQKKAKIMRKVTFPHELDVVEFCTDELKAMLVPVRDKVRDVRKDIEDVERARKRQKRLHDKEAADLAAGITDAASSESKDKAKKDEKKDDKKPAAAAGSSATATAADNDTEMTEVYKTDAEIEAERAASILASKKELAALISPTLAADEGSNKSGLYELRGVVTHQGASADSGHYTSYVKKQGPLLDGKTGKRGPEDGNWWWFNDDKVSEVGPEKIDALAGGGESHSAWILLYRAIPLPGAEGQDE